MSTVSITTKTRMIVGDLGVPFVANVTADGQSNIFDLPVQAISAIAQPPVVSLGNVIISSQATPQYIIDYKYGIISFYSALSAGTVLSVSGLSYNYYTDDEVTEAVSDSFSLHVNDQEPLPVIDAVPGQASIPSVEEYLVALLAATELLWFQATDTSQQIDIHTPEGVTIPRAQRFQQITQQISNIKAEYVELSNALGVGVNRIYVTNMRRVSATTNRLVPIFREQEYNHPYSGFYPTAANVGSLITIWGKYFTGATDIQFGGVSCGGQFTVVDDCQITVTVPVGALTGQIGIITPFGVVLSTAQFVVGSPPPFIRYGPELVTPPVPSGL
jgi:hypothetical protein